MAVGRGSKTAEPKPAPTWFSPEYAAECDKRIRKISIGYETGPKVIALRVHAYKRTDPEIKRGQIMSASSGPKDYLCNDVISLFESDERIEQVALLLLAGTPFIVYRMGSWWFDRSKPDPRRVLVTEA